MPTSGRDGSFGVLLRRLREAAGMTQEHLAERAGLSSEAVAALERGARRRPYRHTVQALAGALGLSDAERVSLLDAVPKRGAGDSQEVVPAPSPPIPPTTLVGRERSWWRLTIC